MDEVIINYAVERFNMIRETVKIEWDSEGNCVVTGRQNGTIEHVSISGEISNEG